MTNVLEFETVAEASRGFDGRAFINGKRENARGGVFRKRSPVDGLMMPNIARGMPEDIKAAVGSARIAFEDGRWSGVSPVERKRVLLEWARLVREHASELAMMETLDMGKLYSRALTADVAATANTLAWYGEAIDKVYGEIAPTGPNSLALVTREAVGVVGAIVPWNYPLLMSAWKIAPALASGNSVVLKPSERSPFSAMRLAELGAEAGLPPGVLNVVPGYGHEAGMALALHEDVDTIAFTGSTRVGRMMLEFSGRSNLKRVYSELGGKSAVVVMPDGDVERAAKATAAAMFFNQGQSCNAPSRLLVHRAVHDRFVDAFAAQAQTFAPGDPVIETSRMGALVDEAHLKSVLRHIVGARRDGARCVTGGARVLAESGGWFVEPTVFDSVTPQMRLANEEIFGPVAAILTFDTEAEAIQIANDSIYGLQAGVWSQDLSTAHRIARKLRAGTVHVNQYDDDDITVPFGGVKQSGNGRDKSLHALDKYTELKTTWLRIDGVRAETP
jgi:gamma-glutamyl-gamma-aminobutyraldehyde dehydrogenase